MWPKLLVILSLAMFISGCKQQPITINSLDARQNFLRKMQVWQAKGRVAIREPDACHTASITWSQDHGQYDIFLSNPLAAQSLHVTPANISDTYLYEIPVTHLRYWLKGVPSPDIPVQEAKYGSCNQLEILQQDGWRIQYLSYAPYPPIMLPEKIIAYKDEIYLKIIINCWNR